MNELTQESLDRVPVEEALGFGWEKMKSNFLPLLGVLVVFGIGTIFIPAIQFFNQDYFKSHFMDGVEIAFINVLLQWFIGLGLISVQLKACRGEPYNPLTLFTQAARLLNYLIATLFYTVIVIVGTICFIVPGIMLHIKLQFYRFLIVDKKMGPIKALKASWQMTKGVKMKLFLFDMVCGFVTSAGFLVFVVGAVPAAMIVFLAETFVYDRLRKTTPELASEDAVPIITATG